MYNPIKPTLKTEIIPFLLLIFTFALSFYFYNNFPETVPVHWNLKGEADNFGPRWVAAILMPMVILFLYIMFLVLPLLDPRKKRYKQFTKTYHVIKISLVFFMFIVYLISGFKILGYNIPIEVWMPSMVGILFMVLGNYISKIKNNWFVGIRTPWTLSSEEVWNKTHRLAGKIFVIGGLVMISIQFISASLQMTVFFIMIATMVLVPIVYSYLIYLKNENEKHKNNQQSK